MSDICMIYFLVSVNIFYVSAVFFVFMTSTFVFIVTLSGFVCFSPDSPRCPEQPSGQSSGEGVWTQPTGP